MKNITSLDNPEAVKLTGKVYHQPGTGLPYTVVVLDGKTIVIKLERANRALPVTI